MNRQILQGDVLDKLKEIPTKSIDCIISSPPYWGLRDYGVDGQLGLEPDFRGYLKTMARIMDELKRVLKGTGSCWINLGDTYAGTPVGRFNGYEGEFKRRTKANFDAIEQGSQLDKTNLGVFSKSRFGIPERFYINCIDSGWIARNHIPWYKSNSMPSSVKDRFSNKWESVFFFVKNQKYYFNLDAVREKTITESKPFNVRVRESKKGLTQQKLTGGCSEEEDQNYNKKGEIKEKYADNSQSNVTRLHKDRVGNSNKTTFTLQDISKLTTQPVSELTPSEICKLIGYDPEQSCEHCSRSYKRHITTDRGVTSHNNYPVFALCNSKGKNPGDVFFINPRPFPQAHFATFPVDLPLHILKCACPQQVCIKCGIPRYPIREVVGQTITNSMKVAGCDDYGLYHGQSTKDYKSNKAQNASDSKRSILESMSKIEKITGYTKCSCNESFHPGIVLDPFFGAGTVGVAAEQLGLQWIGIELNEEYITIAKKRLDQFNTEKLETFV